jgi:hypothetical protein
MMNFIFKFAHAKEAEIAQSVQRLVKVWTMEG